MGRTQKRKSKKRKRNASMSQNQLQKKRKISESVPDVSNKYSDEAVITNDDKEEIVNKQERETTLALVHDTPIVKNTETSNVTESSQFIPEPYTAGPSGSTAFDLDEQKRLNFIYACIKVSCQAYFNYRERLLMLHIPSCITDGGCAQHDKTNLAKEISPQIEEAFMVDYRAHMWFDALEVCIMCITPAQYLSDNVLMEIVEIMLNVHNDVDSDSNVVMKCQQVLMQNFGMHPPCARNKPLLKCYNDFLKSPLNNKENTLTNRKNFGHDQGIVIYCLNRLEYEMSSESVDGSLIDISPSITPDSLQSFNLRKETCEIYECLPRTERIDRLMAVLDSIIELIQFDLAIWHSNNTNVRKKRIGLMIQTFNRPILVNILWSENNLYVGGINRKCVLIFRIFIHMIHLNYPEKHIATMTLWLNALFFAAYMCDSNSHENYPHAYENIHSLTFLKCFYEIISDLPHDTIVRVLDHIRPLYIREMIGVYHLKCLLSTEEDSVVKILNTFIKKSQWNRFEQAENEIEISKDLFSKSKTMEDVLQQLDTIMSVSEHHRFDDNRNNYPKIEESSEQCKLTVNHVVHTLYVTLQACLEAYSMKDVLYTIVELNKRINPSCPDAIRNEIVSEVNSYSWNRNFIKKYKCMHLDISELTTGFRNLKVVGAFPEVLNIFHNINILGLEKVQDI